MSLLESNEDRRAAALLAAAIYCNTRSVSSTEVLGIAREFDRFVQTGQI
jgi:hypothetical protein